MVKLMTFSFLNLLLILLIAWVAGLIVTRLGYPAVLGELAAGIVFGPPLLGWIHGDEGIALLGRLGVLLMMLYVGMRVDLTDLLRSAAAALLITLGGFLVPFGLGYLVNLGLGGDANTGLVLGTVIGVTALATLPRITVDLDFVETRLGQTLIGVALFSVAISLATYTLISGIIEAGNFDLIGLVAVLGRLIAFALAAVVIGKWLLPALCRRLFRTVLAGRTAAASLIFLTGVLYGLLAEAAGLHVILGGFLAGLFLEEDLFPANLFAPLTELVRDVSLGFLTPIFFVSAGFAFSFGAFQSNLFLLVLVLVAAFSGKIIGGLVCSMLARRGWREGLVLGMGINGRGGVDVVLAGASLSSGFISAEVFSVLIFTTFLTTLSVPILLKWGVGWLRRDGQLAGADS